MVYTEGPSSNLISRGKKNPISQFALTSKLQKFHEVNAVTHKISGVAREYIHLVKFPDRKIWERSFANELGKLAKGIRMVKGTNTVLFIPKAQVLKDKKETYGKIVCKVKPKKEDKERTRLTAGGNL